MIQYNGNLGINIINPTASIHVVGTNSISTTTSLQIDNTIQTIFTIKNNGNIGVNTATPSYPIHLIGDMTIFGTSSAMQGGLNIVAQNTVPNRATIRFLSPNLTNNLSFISSRVYDSGNQDGIMEFMSSPIGTSTGSTFRFMAADDTTKGVSLYVQSVTASGYTQLSIGSVHDNFYIGIGTVSFRFNKSGLFGINTIPTVALDVNGQAKISSDLMLPNLTASQTDLVIISTTGSISRTSSAAFITNGLSASYIIQNGNTFGATATIGTLDNQAIILKTNNIARLTIATGGTIYVGTNSFITASYGTVNIGRGAFDGVSSGFFSGVTSGTSLAINEISSYTGDLIRAQRGGADRFRVDNAGNTYIGGSGINFAVNSTSLSITGIIATNGFITINATNNAFTAINLYGSGYATPNIISFITANVETVRMNASNQVGIGATTSISARLQVKGTGTTASTNTLIIQNANNVNTLTMTDDGTITYGTASSLNYMKTNMSNVTSFQPLLTSFTYSSLTSSYIPFSLVGTVSSFNSGAINNIFFNLQPTLNAVTGSQVQTAFKINANFTGTTSTNIIADFSSQNGSMFSVVDGTTGSIFNVNDISGIPIVNATSDWDFNVYDFPDTVLTKQTKNLFLGVTGSSASSITLRSDMILNEGYGLSYRMNQVLATTSTTATSILWSGSIAITQSMYIEAKITAYSNNATMDSIVGELKGSFKRTSATISIVGTTSKFLNTNNGLVDANFGLSASTININIVGAAGETYGWRATVITSTF